MNRLFIFIVLLTFVFSTVAIADEVETEEPQKDSKIKPCKISESEREIHGGGNPGVGGDGDNPCDPQFPDGNNTGVGGDGDEEGREPGTRVNDEVDRDVVIIGENSTPPKPAEEQVDSSAI